MNTHNPPHPGEFISGIYLEPNNISGRELAQALGVAASTLCRVFTQPRPRAAGQIVRMHVRSYNAATSYQLKSIMPYTSKDFAYGPVIVLRGTHKGRIGDFDDDTTHRGKPHAIVKFSHPFLTPYYTYIPIHYLDTPNTQQLMARFDELFKQLSPFVPNALEGAPRITALEEFAYVSSLLNDRMFSAQFEKGSGGIKVFISHSSTDKQFVRGLAVDLSAIGIQPWLDEWEILAGESIVEKVGVGIEDADLMIVVLSQHAIASKWVENEWQAKYWAEVNERKVAVIPVLLEECNIPTLLRAKKYVDFRADYTSALELLMKSIVGNHKKTTSRKPQSN